VADTQYLVTFAVMLVTALTISALTDRVRRQAHFARQRERRTAALFELSRRLAASQDVDAIVNATMEQVGAVFAGDLALLGPSPAGALVVRGRRGAPFADDLREAEVARWVYEHGQTAGAGAAVHSTAHGRYLPLTASRGIVGVLAIRPSPDAQLREAEQLRLLESFANQTALAIERANIATEAREAWERVEAEFMRNTLLSSVSHDLRTPLAGITLAAGNLVHGEATLPPATRRELTGMILDEAERMNRLIGNLLDMTRLESGGLVVLKEWQPIQEVIGAAIRHMSKRLGDRPVRTKLPADLPMVPIDALAIEQVLVNLLDNAVEYTPRGAPIEISANTGERQIVVEVADGGPGLPAGREQQVFQKFFRAHGNGGRRGIGLGLAICKGLVEAHGGSITAANRPAGGAAFTFTLPIEGAPPPVPAED
jgi:two-component system sensor histidine kinase KdpD